MKLTSRHYLLLPLLALTLPSCMLGPTEMGLVAVVIILLFGGAKLPQLMRGMGSGINEFKKGLREGEGESEGEDKDEKKDKALPDKED